jgi:hypothetical protein
MNAANAMSAFETYCNNGEPVAFAKLTLTYDLDQLTKYVQRKLTVDNAELFCVDADLDYPVNKPKIAKELAVENIASSLHAHPRFAAARKAREARVDELSSKRASKMSASASETPSQSGCVSSKPATRKTAAVKTPAPVEDDDVAKLQAQLEMLLLTKAAKAAKAAFSQA